MVKSKVRFDGLDCAALVAYWNRTVLGRRVINIYNGPNGDTYLFKLDKLSKDEDSNLMIIIESGIRFHTTRQPYENPGAPTPFCSKLRKHLRGLRLEQVQQLGLKDRVVNLVFGSGETQRHSLILELYARGNIILANAKYEIQCLLRSHEYDGVKVQVGHVYPITYATTTAVQDTNDNDNPNRILLTAGNPIEWYQPFQPKEGETEATTKKSKKGGDGSNSWKGLLSKPESGVSHYGPSLLDHCILCAGVESQKPQDLDETGWKHLQSVLKEEGDRIMTLLELADSKGYILYQPKEAAIVEEPKQDKNEQAQVKQLPPSPFADKFLLEFQPHLLKQHEGLASLEYDSFDRATDDFFSHIEGQKRFQRVETQQLQAQQRLEKIRKDQEQRVESLVEQQESMKRQARLVELHADMVEKAIQVVNSALDSGMDWEQLEDLVHVERTQNRNPVALLIHKLDLENDNLVLRLPKEEHSFSNHEDDEEEEDAEEDTMDITISLKDTAHGNASALFAKYRASKEKGQKTMEASVKALEAAEDTAQRQLQDAQKKKGHLSQALHTKRKLLWFEKFHWFITTDNYLVIAGRDAQQNEQLVKRYLRPGDAYLHADVHGAASCILRAKRSRQGEGGKTVPLALSDQALREAGNFTICKSSAWNSRMVTSAWWVESHQVSKTAPTGEYLTVGSFMIRGKKNFLPPTQLEMGLGVLFRLGDEESIARHKNDRRDFALMEMEQDDIPLDDDLPPLQPEKIVSKPKAPVAVAVVDSSKLKEEENTVPDTDDIQEEQDVEKDKSPDDSENDDDDDDNKDQNDEIEDQNGENEDDQSQQMESNQPKKKKGLSVRDRKLIRKYGSLEAGMAAEEERLKNEGKPDASVTSASNPGTTEQSTNDAPKRGRKARQKKIAKKYADQDEDDRELALLALHAGEKSKKKDKGKKAPAINETEKEAAAETLAILKKDASIAAAELDEEVRKILAECITVKSGDSVSPEEADVRWDKFDADVIEQLLSLDKEQKLAAAKRLLNLKQGTRIDNFSASLAGIIRTIRKYGHKNLDTDTTGADDGKRKTKADKEAESTAWKQTLAEEGVVDEGIEEDTIDDTIELMKLTGKPHPEDLILFAVPVCAPYISLTKYNHRVKLTPGNLKRGKASKQCIAMFLKDGPKTPANERNRELVKKVADNEWVQAICGDVKISAAGASKLVKKQKTNKKSKNKK
jgi:predicted ribosome quality control (RQC) complex YloA/Tae2 family protein